MNRKYKKTILFISTDATRNGAPILLLNIIKWLKNNSDYNFVFLMQKNGNEILDEYEKLGKEMGFRHVESGALVRSSYHAEKHIL